jgi:signal transduction histidine kinase
MPISVVAVHTLSNLETGDPMPVEKQHALTHFLAIARTIAGPMDHERVLVNFAEGLKEMIPHDHLDFVLLRKDGTQICFEAPLRTTWSQVENPFKPTDTSPIKSVLLGDVDYILTRDAWTDRQFHFKGADDTPIFDANLHSRIIVPLRVQGDVIGSLAISSHTIGRYKEGQLEIAQGAADLVAAYLFALDRGNEAKDAAVAESEARGREEALRVGVQRLTEGIEHERQRLGMDIHDQTLADLARLSRRLASVESANHVDRSAIGEISTDLKTCLTDLRRIVEDMKPGVLQMFGLEEAIDAHLRRHMGNDESALSATVVDETKGQVDTLPEMVKTALYRIVQEATTNAVRHSCATRVSVSLCQKNGFYVVAVEDNGRGIDTENLNSINGISNIKTRAQLISAKAEFSRIGKTGGTIVQVTLPEQQEPNELTE